LIGRYSYHLSHAPAQIQTLCPCPPPAPPLDS
jgi:hypothetical protein